MIIRTANQQAIVLQMGGYRPFVERETKMRWAGVARVNWQARGEVQAWINRSSWAANCPFCRESLVAEPGEPFFCPNCCMVQNGGCAMAVIFPAERAEIERRLLLRPDPDTRSWYPHETVEMLAAENAAHGIGA